MYVYSDGTNYNPMSPPTSYSYSDSHALLSEKNHILVGITPSIVTQTVSLVSGTNWFSTYVDITLEELQSAIQDALGTSVNATLKSRDANIRYTRGRWGNTPSNFVWDVALMYKIEVAAACEFTLEGMPLDPAEHTITLAGNGTYNWIGFPFAQSMSLTDAFAGFAVNGDAIKGKVGNNKYSRGRWSNSGLTTLEPGQGYMYVSEEAENRVLTYPSSAK
jgi:hypothetical protein